MKENVIVGIVNKSGTSAGVWSVRSASLRGGTERREGG